MPVTIKAVVETERHRQTADEGGGGACCLRTW